MAIDTELVEQIRHGNREAYGELFRKYYAQIYSLCLSILNNPQDAEEVAQEMFIHAYLKLDGLRKSDSFFPWLKKIAQNRSRDFVRQAARRKPLSLADKHTNAASPDDKLLRQELMNSTMEAIEALPARDREVIQARIDGLNHAEISERFGISVKASMTRLYRARRRLAERLKGLYSIFSLARIFHPKAIVSGGVVAMKIGTGAKVTIGIIGILAAGITGFLISTHQLETTKTGEGQGAARTEQGGANALEKTSEAPDGQQSVMGADEKEGWNALMGILDEMDEAPDTRGTGLRSGASEGTPSGTENSEISQDHPEMEYHKAYDTFIAIAKEIAIVQAEMAPVSREAKRLTDEWKRNRSDPKNRTEEERLVGEMRENVLPTLEEYLRLNSRLSSLTDSLFNEIEAAVPGAVQRESVDTPNGTVDVTRIDYKQIRSALGALPEEHDTYLAELFTGFAVMFGEFHN